MILRIVRVRPPPSVQNYARYFYFMKSNSLLLLFLFFTNCAYYNTFYNAEKYFKEAEVIIDDTKKDDNEIPQQAKKLLSQSIEKSQKVLDKFPNSKYIDDSYFLIGKSSFIKGDYSYSEKYFRKLVNEFPNSTFLIESKLWISYTLLKNSYSDSSLNYINSIKDVNLNDTLNYLKNLVLAEINLSKSKRMDAYNNFERAIEFSKSNSKKSSMYKKLVSISEKNKDFDKLIYFLDRLNFHSQNEEIKLESKLKWLKYNREVGNLDLVRSEINTLLTRSDYEKIFLSLELEKIKILISESKNDLAKDNLLYIVENNSKKKETAESYYLLGLHYLKNEWDLDKSKEYFSNVKNEYTRSIYVDNSIELKNTIEKYQGLEKIFNSQQAGDTSTVEFTIDEEERADEPFDMNYNLPNMMNDLSNKYSNPNSNMYPEWEEENISSVVIKGTIDSLIFAMGEILYFDFQQLDSAKSKFNFLYANYPESKFTPQALFILANTAKDSLIWKEKLFNDYSNNNFVSILKGEKIIDNDIDVLEQKRDSLWNVFEIYPDSAAIGFIKLYEVFDDSKSLYSGAFIYDNYLNDIQQTKKYYQIYIEKFSKSQFFSKANNRLNSISEILKDSTNEKIDTLITQQNIFINEPQLPNLPPILKDINVPIISDSFFVSNDSIGILDSTVSSKEDSALTTNSNTISEIDPSFDSLNVLPFLDDQEKNVYDLEPIYDWKDHIVKKGETLEKIAVSYYNSSIMVDSLYIWNSEILVSKDLIYPYTLIKLKSIKLDENEFVYIDHVIKKGESLWSISNLIYNDPYGWKLVYNDNRESLINGENNLTPGNILKIRKIQN